MKKIKSFKDFIKESVELAEPKTKPTTRPTTKPTTRPSRPDPFRKDKPSVIPKPKASSKDVADKFLKLTKGNKEIENFLMKKYSKNITEKFMGGKNEEKLSVDLRGPEGNAYALLGLGNRLCKQLKEVNPEKYNWEEISKKMMSDDYKHLVNTFEEYFGDFVDIYNTDVLDEY